MTISIRPYQDKDLTALAHIYKQGIRHVGREYYSQEQVEVWSSFADDTRDFEKWINDADTYVAQNGENQVVGFAGLEEKGRISSLFVAPEVMGTGIGTALLSQLMEEIKKREITSITTDASEFSKPLFEKFGFRTYNIEQSRFKGMVFQRYKMIMTQ